MTKRTRRGSQPRRRPRDTYSGVRDYEMRALREAAVTRSARRRRAMLLIAIATIALLVLGLIMSTMPASAAAAAPTPSPATGDVRSSSAPGLAGDPLFAVGGVAVVAALAVGVTLFYVRLTASRAGN